MIFDEGDMALLCQLGVSKAQADVYLLLLKIGRVDVKTLANNSDVARSAIYRTLGELQKMGLVEKELSLPNKFKATRIEHGLQILMIQKTKEFEQFKAKTAKFLRKAQMFQEDAREDEEYKFIVIEGKERIIQRMRLQHDSVQREVNILTTPNRWIQILEFCLENYERSLKRKVNYRVVLEKPEWQFDFPGEVQSLLEKPNFELRFSHGFLTSNAATFDGKEATLSLLPSKASMDSPIIWTNHSSFLSMCNDHFEKVWALSEK
jgi:sugar-specific transcriptional regulator TrmB